jgi:hypothetical protein
MLASLKWVLKAPQKKNLKLLRVKRNIKKFHVNYQPSLKLKKNYKQVLMFIKKVGCYRLIYIKHFDTIPPKSGITRCDSVVYKYISSVTLLSKLSKL